ncbi:MAG: carbohydrate ABC transporter permease [Oscillospiraceae bacterium]|jgi:putative aldouronate transport system permease protein|nr:carbohydrate ABC transporter permease [Oscillospiraceae bacterium]
MSVAKSASRRASRLTTVGPGAEAVFHLILGLFSLACVVPFIFVIIISFSSEPAIRANGFSFLPAAWSLDAYRFVMRLGDQLWRSYFNSFFITVVGTALSVLICVLYAYPLFRRDYKYRGFFTFFSFFTTLFGGGLVPTYMVSKFMLGLSDNYAALIVPLLVSPFYIIVMRTFYSSTVPEALIESASIDGSGEYRTLFQIILPICLPGIATIALLNALAYWNEWFIAMLYITKPQYIPLQYLLMRMQNQADFLARNSSMIGAEAVNLVANQPTETLRMALVVFIVLPIACAYPFFQRFIISGLTIGSVKG